jgi:hypothetical protein
MQKKSSFLAITFGFVLLFIAGYNLEIAKAELSTGQTIYVPCYSQIYHGPKTRPFDLTISLSVRNIDLEKSFKLLAVDYYNTKGTLVRSYIQDPIEFPPLMTKKYVIEQMDTSGGPGANFIVRWKAEEKINAPVIESVMIGTSSGQGISFTSRGVVLE